MYPPNLELLEKHYQANKVGTIANLDDFCICCSKPVNKNPVSLNIPRALMGFLGPLFPLFFNFIIYCILLSLIILLVNIYAIYRNNRSTNCIDPSYNCTSNSVIMSSLINNSDLNTQSLQNLICVIIILIANQLYIRQFRNQAADI